MNKPVVVLLVGSVLFGLMWIPLKFFHTQGLGAIPINFVAYGVLSIVFFPLILKHFAQWKSQYPYLLVIFIFGGLANLTFSTAMVYGDVVRAIVLFYLLPAWGVLGGWFFLNEKIDKVRGLSVILALSGAFFVFGGGNILQTPPSWIDAIALASGFFLALNNIAFRASPNLPITIKLGTIFTGSCISAGVILLFQAQSLPVISNTNWLLLIAFGLTWILGATICTQWAVTRLEVGRSSVLIIMELIVAVSSAILLGNESATATEMLGGLLILIAAILEGVRQPSKAKADG